MDIKNIDRIKLEDILKDLRRFENRVKQWKEEFNVKYEEWARIIVNEYPEIKDENISELSGKINNEIKKRYAKMKK